MFARKGDRIRWTSIATPSLAGMQMKVQVTYRTGVIRHVRGNDPVVPTSVRIYVDPDDGAGTVRPIRCTCAGAHVEIDPEDTPIEVLAPGDGRHSEDS